MGGDAVKKVNPFDSQGTIGRAVLTGGMSLVPELATKKALELTAPKEIGAPEAAPPPPTAEDPAIAQAQQDQRNARGRASTILSGPNGNRGSGLIARRTLLGT